MKTLAAALLLLGLAPLAARADDTIAHGAYLARAADCVACHTAPGGQDFAGGRAFQLPFGVIYAPNITPDATGIAGYSDDDWVRVMHDGVARGGKHLYPAMPYPSYTQMSRDDALAIKAYLMSLAPVRATVPANTLRFPFNQRWGMAAWNLLNNPNQRFQPDTTKSADYNRGAYLVNALGHCGECHTPRNLTQGLKRSDSFAGAIQVGWRAYNLTSDPATGLANWTDAALEQYLSTGPAPGHGPASGPMAEAVSDSLRYLQPADIHAMAVYLRGIPAHEAGPAVASTGTSAAPTDPLGARLFAQACAGCHLPSGDGRQSAWAALGGAHSAADPAATNLLQVLVHGSDIQTSQGRMFMHGFTRAYTDPEVAAIANYVAGQFGGHAGNVTPAEVAKARSSG
jgi:mono/diheme cytochrome c family protein